MKNYSIQIIQELERLFCDDKFIFTKLKIIEFYEEVVGIQEEANHNSISKESIVSKTIDYITCHPDITVYFKASRINQFIDAYNISKNKSGYIQPIGKEKFLKKFLTQYPTPLMLHLADEYWSQNSLSHFIEKKYNCIITPDTIRKELSSSVQKENIITQYQKLVYEKMAFCYSHNRPIYFILLYKNPFPIRNIKYNATDGKNCSVSGFIYGINKNQDIEYQREPFFQISYDFKREFFNLDYIYQIAVKPGLILLEDTPYAREILPQYFYYHLKHKTLPTNLDIYLLLDELYDYNECKLMYKFDAITLLLRPILTQYVASLPTSARKIPTGGKLLNTRSAFSDLKSTVYFDWMFDYHVIKKKNKQKSIPYLLPLDS